MRRATIALFILLLMVSAARASGTGVDFFQSFSSNWALRDKPSLYDKDNLFDHINGEADLYFPYGFEQLASGTYANRKDPELWIVADVYRMGSGLDAFGIYSNYRRPDYNFVKIGAEGFVSPSQLLFYQDRYFVRIQVTGETEVDENTLLDCGKAISGRLPADFKTPPQLEVFNIPEAVPKSERYIAKSLLGLDFLRSGIVADAAGRGQKFQVFLIYEDSPQAARQTLSRFAENARSESKDAPVRLSDQQDRAVLELIDPLYGKVYVEQRGRHLLGAVRVKDMTAAKAAIENMRRKLEKTKE